MQQAQEKSLATRSSVPSIPVAESGILAPQDFNQMWYLAEIFAKSGMVPKQYTNNPPAIVVAWQFGVMLGLNQLTSLQNIAVVNGSPSVWGDAMKALVQESGTLELFVEYFTGTYPQEDYTAVCIAKRKGEGFDYNPETSLDDLRKMGLFVNEFSVADAKRAGLWSKDSPWRTNPKRMLKMRARSFTLRDGWPDVLKGMHSVEEMQDAVDLTPGPDGTTYSMSASAAALARTESKLTDLKQRLREAQQNEHEDPEADDKKNTPATKVPPNDAPDPRADKAARTSTPGRVPEAAASYPQTQSRNPGADNRPPEGYNMAGEPKKDARSGGKDNPWHNADNWVNLRTRGFPTYVWRHLPALREASESVQDEVRDKWHRMKLHEGPDGVPFPLDKADEQPAAGDQAASSSSAGDPTDNTVYPANLDVVLGEYLDMGGLARTDMLNAMEALDVETLEGLDERTQRRLWRKFRAFTERTTSNSKAINSNDAARHLPDQTYGNLEATPEWTELQALRDTLPTEVYDEVDQAHGGNGPQSAGDCLRYIQAMNAVVDRELSV